MKNYFVLSIIFLLSLISCKDHQTSERARIKYSAERFSEKIKKNNDGIIEISHFSEKSKFPNTYSITIRFSREYSFEEMKNIVSAAYRGIPPWSVGSDWIFDVDRYTCILYDTSSDIVITYGYLPAHPTQLAMLINSYSAINKLANE